MSLTLACYNSILPSFSCIPDEDGLIDSVNPTGTKKPATIGGATLVLPTQARLRKGFPEEMLPFHPLCESMARQGTSPVIQYLQRAAKAYIAYSVVTMAQHLLEIACDKTLHKDLPPDCLDFLVKLADVDTDKNIKTVFTNLISAATKKNRLVTVYLKNGGTFNGSKVNRSCIIRIPVMEDLQQKGKTVLGVGVSEKQRRILIALFKLIVPFGDNPEEYSYGTTSRQAPYLQCLLVAYAKITKVLNQCINNYGVPLQLPIKPIPTYDPEIINTFEKARMEVEIPALRGNEGGSKETAEEASDTLDQPIEKVPSGVAKVEQVSRSTPAQTTVSTSAPGTVSMSEFMQANNPQPTLMNVNFQNNQQSNLNGSFGQQPQQSLFGQPQQQPQVLFGQQQQQQSLFGQPQQSMFNGNGGGLPWQQPVQQPQQSLFGQPAPNVNFNMGHMGGSLGLI